MILPEKVDSVLTRYASRSYYDELTGMGVRIHLYRKGLLHTKSVTADRRISMFGTVNLDMRSLWLNYEVALFVYGAGIFRGPACTSAVLYRDCECLDPVEWSKRPRRVRFLRKRPASH